MCVCVCVCVCRLRSLFLAGERCDVETLDWAQKIFRVPVLDHWWQTGERALSLSLSLFLSEIQIQIQRGFISMAIMQFSIKAKK